ncbi:TRAP transporter small permease [Comamonadaceae bacterium G21597-S1]|nr:TRAP transporter small permease [Comamonadaceae bacterium G21597-S1]
MNGLQAAPKGHLARLCLRFERLAMLLLAVMTGFILVLVTARNVFALGLPWAEELARYAGLGVVYLAVPLLLQDKHIKVDLLLKRLRGNGARALNVVNELIVLGFALLFLWGGWLFLLRAAQFSTPALSMPNWLYYLPAALGMVLFALVALQRVLRALRGPARDEGAVP